MRTKSAATSARPARLSRWPALLAPMIGTLAAGTVLVAGCAQGSSGPGVASVGSAAASSTSGTSSTSNRASALAYAQCMRSHGVPRFPDPDSNGHLGAAGGPGSGVDPQSTQYQAATQACRSLMPGQSGPHFSPNRAQNLKFAQCMRAHRISDFPDPNPDGTFGSGGNLDPNSPQYQAANNACKHYLAQQPGGGS